MPLARNPQRASSASTRAARCEPIEERGDEHRVGEQHHDVERHPDDPHRPPPGASHHLHQPEHHGEEWQAEDGADRRTAREVREIQGQTGPVEAESGFQHKGAVEIERQVDRGKEYQCRDHQRQTVRQAAGFEPAGGPIRQSLNAAAERHRQQYHDAKQQIDQPETVLRHRVVGCFAMRVETDPGAERGGYLLTVSVNVAHLTQRQPGPKRRRQEERGKESNRPSVHDLRERIARIHERKRWRQIRTTSSGSTWK
jgi:hypothetical protein